ncbi:hypothetical protein [Mucilaginibacter sp. 10I4]|uniref:hypothetical protein n=1 Tax=Mucilaginibacter sp. 10I4 TaxID=3048580 RepID=UPI002B22AE6C|nr:hypothetical protein [Mucilaginibacter sp. 10I4]MEB0262917.1 hypothetical protein [Mucilaginibacter sp. 10I4]
MIDISNDNGVFIITDGCYRYATKGSVVVCENPVGVYYLTFDTHNVSFNEPEIGTINGEPIVDLFKQICAIIT